MTVKNQSMESWLSSLKATRDYPCRSCYSSRYRWVFPGSPDSERTREEYPYSYSDHYLWGGPETTIDCFSVYSDRIFQQRAEAREIWRRVCGQGQYFSSVSSEKLSEFLSEVFGYPTEVKALSEGCNQSSGYPYWILWFTKGPNSNGY